MNKKQRIVLFVTASLLILMLLFPPFGDKSQGVPVQYRFILAPSPVYQSRNDFIVTERLFAQASIVLVAGILCCFALKEKKPNT